MQIHDFESKAQAPGQTLVVKPCKEKIESRRADGIELHSVQQRAKRHKTQKFLWMVGIDIWQDEGDYNFTRV